MLTRLIVAVLIPAYSDVAEEIGALKIEDKFYGVVAQYGGSEIVRNEAINQLSISLNEGMQIFANKFLVPSALIIAVCIIVTRVLFALKTMPMMDVVNSFMSTNSEYDFASNFVHNIKPSFRYSLIYSLFCLPFDGLLIAYILYGLVPTMNALSLFGPAAALIVICSIFALRRVFLTNWVPEMLVNGGKAWPALGYSIKAGAKNFIEYFLNFFGYSVLVWALVAGLTISSFGVAAIILFPFARMFSKVYDLVDYYERRGMRYYSERDDVVVPEGAEPLPAKEEE